VVLSDDAGQFAIGQHALCWVHAERLVHKLDAFTEPHRAAQQKMRKLIWNFYADLKAYKANPDKRRHVALRARFDSIFRRRTGFATLDRLLGRDCRDAFLGLAKTCARHGVAFWDYLGSRLNVPGHTVVPPLAELVRCRGQPA
jgi:hypothetical protein